MGMEFHLALDRAANTPHDCAIVSIQDAASG
jgi:hypothetical protein